MRYFKKWYFFYKDEKGKKLLSLYKVKEIDYINIFSLLANEKEE